ncbi:MAG: hypothetical protein LBJ88_04805 [Campylobacteraceae bacterium]|jgi:translation elongation factor EF-Ts|nr:hypothetical protein [Campylobacteraceae bacterium]
MKNIKSLFNSNTLLKTSSSIGKHRHEYKDLVENAKCIFESTFDKNEYKNYVQYLVGDDFEKQYDEFENEIADMISNKVLNYDKAIIYTYIALAIMFVLQIVILLRVK